MEQSGQVERRQTLDTRGIATISDRRGQNDTDDRHEGHHHVRDRSRPLHGALDVLQHLPGLFQPSLSSVLARSHLFVDLFLQRAVQTIQANRWRFIGACHGFAATSIPGS